MGKAGPSARGRGAPSARGSGGPLGAGLGGPRGSAPAASGPQPLRELCGVGNCFLRFSDDVCVECLFTCVFSVCVSSFIFGEVSVQVVCPFVIKLFIFLLS